MTNQGEFVWLLGVFSPCGAVCNVMGKFEDKIRDFLVSVFNSVLLL